MAGSQSISHYELQRQERIANNKKRMEDMGIAELTQGLSHSTRTHRPPPKPKTYRPTVSAGDAPPRRSTRSQGKPAPVYQEVLDNIDAPRRKRGKFSDRDVFHSEERYTQEHVALLGDYKQPWTLFVDGYDAKGVRIYDSVNGQTCHQCRQKTMGKRTTCSRCQSLHGVFCGDCLFMRYGENVEEVNQNPDWVCPPCRDLCNCSNHRIRRGWAPTGTLYRRAIAEGYKSVAHYLVLNKLDAEPSAPELVTVTEGLEAAAEKPSTPCSRQKAAASPPGQPGAKPGYEAAAGTDAEGGSSEESDAPAPTTPRKLELPTERRTLRKPAKGEAAARPSRATQQAAKRVTKALAAVAIEKPAKRQTRGLSTSASTRSTRSGQPLSSC